MENTSSPRHASDGFCVTGLAARDWAPSRIDLALPILCAPEAEAGARLISAARAAAPRNDIYARVEGQVKEFAPSARRVGDSSQWHAAAQASACLGEIGMDTAISVLRQRPSEQRSLLRMLMDERGQEMATRLSPSLSPGQRHAATLRKQS